MAIPAAALAQGPSQAEYPAPGAAMPVTTAIEISDFCFAYDDCTVIGPVNWEVREGSFALLVGATGCGKTTLLRNLKLELRPTGTRSGSIALFGAPIEELDARTLALTVGYVAQSPDNQIICDSVWHELAFGLENTGTPQGEMRRRVAEVAHFFGIEPWLDRATNELSGGQRQLLTLASILALRPRILLLDEPTGQLDPVAAKNFLHALFRVNRELGLTIVVATHEPEAMADYATAMACMENGSVRCCDIAAYRDVAKQRAAAVDYHAPGICAPDFTSGLPAAELDDVYCRYGRNLPFVLRGLDFALQRGSIHALAGGNGSGKSTLFKVLSEVMRTDRGSVRNQLRHSQALLPQNPKMLFACDSVAEELAEWQPACGYTAEDIEHAAQRFHLANLLRQHPYDLSGGQQQLLAFAKIMLTRPALIMLDEPTKGLDAASKCLVADALCDAVAQGATVLMATHDLSFAARVAHETSLLFDGQIACTQHTGAFFRENLFYQPTIDEFFVTWRHREALAARGEGRVRAGTDAAANLPAEENEGRQ